MVITYGGICLLWLVFNRLVAEESAFMDSILNFAQITGTLGGFGLNWPGEPLPTSCMQIQCRTHPTCFCVHEDAGARMDWGRWAFASQRTWSPMHTQSVDAAWHACA